MNWANERQINQQWHDSLVAFSLLSLTDCKTKTKSWQETADSLLVRNHERLVRCRKNCKHPNATCSGRREDWGWNTSFDKKPKTKSKKQKGQPQEDTWTGCREQNRRTRTEYWSADWQTSEHRRRSNTPDTWGQNVQTTPEIREPQTETRHNYYNSQSIARQLGRLQAGPTHQQTGSAVPAGRLMWDGVNVIAENSRLTVNR